MASKEARDAAIKRAAELVRNDQTGFLRRATPADKVRPSDSAEAILADLLAWYNGRYSTKDSEKQFPPLELYRLVDRARRVVLR